MLVRLLIFLLLTTPLMAVNVYVDTLKDTTFTSSMGQVYDTYIKAGNDSVSNKGANGNSELNNQTRVLIKTGNLKELIGTDRRISACTLAFTTGTDVQNTKGGTLGLYKILTDWWSGKSHNREGALWRYSKAPMFPDTVPQASLPSAFAWTDSALDSEAKNQGSCGACYAHAAAGGFETTAKIQQSDRDLGYNSGNGTGADRAIAPMDTAGITATGKIGIGVDPLTLWEAYNDPTKECGYALVQVTGEYTFTTSEATGTVNRPRFLVNYEIDSGGSTFEEQKIVTGTTYIYETVIKGGADSTTNFATDTSVTLNSTNRVMLIKINDVATIFGDYVIGFATTKCSLYVQNKATNGRANLVRSLKKWVEGEATNVIWKTGYRWHTVGAGKTNELDASEQQLLNCDAYGLNTCLGGTAGGAFEWWRLNGVFSEEDYPYKASDTFSCVDTTGLGLSTRVTWWWQVSKASIGRIKQQILMRPITTAIYLYSGFASAAAGECFVGSGGAPLENGHAVLIVGWDDDYVCGDSTGAWLVRNSWGTGWADYGRAYCSYNNNGIIVYNDVVGNNTAMAETIEEPVMWAGAGMTSGTDYQATACATVAVTTAEAQLYKVAIPTEVVQGWYTDPSSNHGVLIKPYFDLSFPPPDTASVYIGQSGPVAGRPPQQVSPYFIIRSSDATTNIGNTSLGNTKVGR